MLCQTRASVLSRPIAARRNLCVRTMASKDNFTADTKIKIRLDASANGCSGMFWRSKPDMNASVSAPDWPRNGAVFLGWKSQEHPGWVKVDHEKGYWMPIEQHGKPVCHFDAK